jgi:hypothetical protein
MDEVRRKIANGVVVLLHGAGGIEDWLAGRRLRVESMRKAN